MEYYTISDKISKKVFVCYGDVVISRHNTLSEANQEIIDLFDKPKPEIKQMKHLCDLCGRSLIKHGYSVKDTFFNFWLSYETLREDEFLVICLICNAHIDYSSL